MKRIVWALVAIAATGCTAAQEEPPRPLRHLCWYPSGQWSDDQVDTIQSAADAWRDASDGQLYLRRMELPGCFVVRENTRALIDQGYSGIFLPGLKQIQIINVDGPLLMSIAAHEFGHYLAWSGNHAETGVMSNNLVTCITKPDLELVCNDQKRVSKRSCDWHNYYWCQP